jgi:hypothetical protein
MVSTNFVSDYATFAGSNGNTATNNMTVNALFPPTCNFTYIAPELTGPAGLPQTITQGQNATAVVILTPAVGGAAYPTGTVTLTDAFNSSTTTVTLPGNSDTISIPLLGLAAGTHTFTATYSGDSNYPLITRSPAVRRSIRQRRPTSSLSTPAACLPPPRGWSLRRQRQPTAIPSKLRPL